MSELAGMEFDQESISFSRNEWKHFLNEVEMRKGNEIEKCVNNARYLSKLDRAFEQSINGEGVTFTEKGWDDYNSWLDVDNHTLDKVTDMIRDIKNKMELESKKTCSLKIDEDNDLIYIAGEKNFTITSCKGHS